jgi:hypothetical protein
VLALSLVRLTAASLVACRHPDPCEDAAPVEGTAELADNPDAGLTEWLDVSLSVAAPVRVTVQNDDRTWSFDDPVVSTDHHVLLTGLRAEQVHQVEVAAIGHECAGSAASVDFTPPPLPADFPPYRVTVADPTAIEPGVTLLGLRGYLIAVDPAGAPVWYEPIDGSIHEANRTASGDLYVIVNRQTLTVTDLSGAPKAVYRAARTTDPLADTVPVDVDAIHHDAIQLPNGDFAALSIERRWIEDYPASETNPRTTAPAWVAGDVVVEFAPDGTVVKQVALLDLLDPHRIVYDSVDGDYWEDFGPWAGDDIKDWSHGNAVSYDPASDVMLVGLRHQDAVVGIDWSTGELAWIVAPPQNWIEPYRDRLLTSDVDGFVEPYHEHGAKFTASGTVVLFDNGNYRAEPVAEPLPDQQNYSRALEISVDPASGTWHPVWSWGQTLDPSHFSGSLGDVDVLPATDHLLVTFGNLANPYLGGVEVDEVTRDGEVVWQLVIDDPDGTTFRAERLTGLFPGL